MKPRAFSRRLCASLSKGGIRIAVADLRIYVDRYLVNQNGDEFVKSLNMVDRTPQGFIERLRTAISGFRGHKWVYDGQSLATVLTRAGFVEAQVLPAGMTRISDPGPLDLCERAGKSDYVEARKPYVAKVWLVGRMVRTAQAGTKLEQRVGS
jgi:hypothetical protein